MTAHSISARSVRTYLAGTGATGTLMAGAIVAFLSLATVFAFNGLPGDSPPAEEESLFVGAGGAPAAAATALGGAPGAVAAAPAPFPPAALAALVGVGPGANLPPGAGGPGGPTTGGSQVPIPTGPDGAPITASNPGPVGGLADGVDQATGNLGLGPATEPPTDPIDQSLQQNPPVVSDAVGQLGQGVTDGPSGGNGH